MKNVFFGAIAALCLVTLSWALVGVMLAINTGLTAFAALASFLVGLWASGKVSD